MNLFLALIWAGLGLYLIILHATTDYANFRLPLPGNPSGGWLALILAAYNFIQWWARENLRKQQHEAQLREAERRERLLQERHQAEGREIDPNFQFKENPGNEKKSE